MSKNKKLRTKKAGLPPGTLVHIGEKKTESVKFGQIDFDQLGHSERQPLSARVAANTEQQHATRWTNVYGAHQASDIAPLGERYHLHPLVLEDILNTAQRQKVDSYADHLYIVLHRYEISNESLDLVQDQISLYNSSTAASFCVTVTVDTRSHGSQPLLGQLIVYSITIFCYWNVLSGK